MVHVRVAELRELQQIADELRNRQRLPLEGAGCEFTRRLREFVLPEKQREYKAPCQKGLTRGRKFGILMATPFQVMNEERRSAMKQYAIMMMSMMPMCMCRMSMRRCAILRCAFQ